jgi:hypothetical protein
MRIVWIREKVFKIFSNIFFRSSILKLSFFYSLFFVIVNLCTIIVFNSNLKKRMINESLNVKITEKQIYLEREILTGNRGSNIDVCSLKIINEKKKKKN